MEEQNEIKRNEQTEVAKAELEEHIAELRKNQELMKQRIKEIADKIKSVKASLVTSLSAS